MYLRLRTPWTPLLSSGRDELRYERTHLTNPWDSWMPCGDAAHTSGIGGGVVFVPPGNSLFKPLFKPVHVLVYQPEKLSLWNPATHFLLNGTVCSILHLSCFSHPKSTFSNSLWAYINKEKEFVWGMFWRGWWYVCVCIHSWPSGNLLSGNLVFIKKWQSLLWVLKINTKQEGLMCGNLWNATYILLRHKKTQRVHRFQRVGGKTNAPIWKWRE